MQIITCSISENGTANGAKGDQTGREFYLRDWYEYPWTYIIRHCDAQFAAKLSKTYLAMAMNDNIGYGQNDRLTLYDALNKSGSVGEIRTKCNADCSSSVCTAVNYLDKIIKGSSNISPSLTTSSMRNAFEKDGYNIYKRNCCEIKNGDILLTEGKHTAIAYCEEDNKDPISKRAIYYRYSGGTETPTIKKGSKGTIVSGLQGVLNYIFGDNPLVIDGDFGSKTDLVVKTFQTAVNIERDGIVGKNTWGKLLG